MGSSIWVSSIGQSKATALGRRRPRQAFAGSRADRQSRQSPQPAALHWCSESRRRWPHPCTEEPMAERRQQQTVASAAAPRRPARLPPSAAVTRNTASQIYIRPHNCVTKWERDVWVSHNKPCAIVTVGSRIEREQRSEEPKTNAHGTQCRIHKNSCRHSLFSLPLCLSLSLSLFVCVCVCVCVCS